jgi:hypothetical protein
MESQEQRLKTRIEKIRSLARDTQGSTEWFEAAGLAQTVLHDTTGGSHPLMASLKSALEKSDHSRALATSRAVVSLFDEGGLTSPRLAIAHEIEADLLDLAQAQIQAAEASSDVTKRTVYLAIAAFLAGTVIEDSLRRICESHTISYDTQRASIAKLQAALYQPANSIEIINSSENKHITAWGDTRNKAAHGKFDELVLSEAFAMVIGVRGFIDKHLP